ncbi:ribose-5-phosphate isomerase RpiA [Ruminococcus sp. OA3]|uniref:ribose-5-phosphate isomerase RpiA n=1 Tax=Ruminococcus sp. OA3 TaxID=2914164 RepID=UPI001F062D66|nr:ribose-5-phosphate isomerase RpiA [Ruminococcus sp. OA3]MCH1983887.1 ribose-5-phosphate isomerase RpiA [Ruminococcus sp. OA3]
MNQKKIAGEKAAEYIKDGMVVGLGTGSTAKFMVDKVGEMVKNGLKIQAIPTSKATEQQARELGIPLLSIDDVDHIDLDIDGVDEIDSDFNATKGGGGALFREKVVADLAKEVIWIMDESKLVDSIGAFPLPLEVLPYGYRIVFKKMEDFGYNPKMRMNGDDLFVTDNGNYIIDLCIGAPAHIEDIRQKVNSVVGVLETGQFLKMCKRIIVGTDEGVKIIEAE